MDTTTGMAATITTTIMAMTTPTITTTAKGRRESPSPA
jgi:hypothetical protein